MRYKYKISHSCRTRTTCEHSESAQEQRIALYKRSSISQKTAFNAALFSTLTVSDLGNHQVICWVLYKHFHSQYRLQVQTQSKWQSQWEFKSYPSLCVCPSCILWLFLPNCLLPKTVIKIKSLGSKHDIVACHYHWIAGIMLCNIWYSCMKIKGAGHT